MGSRMGPLIGEWRLVSLLRSIAWGVNYAGVWMRWVGSDVKSRGGKTRLYLVQRFKIDVQE